MRSERPPRVGQQGAERRRVSQLRLMDIIPHLRNARRLRDGSVLASCPVPTHGRGRGDLNPSLHLWEEGGELHACCYAGCDARDVWRELRRLAGLDRQRASRRGNTPETPRFTGCTLQQLCEAKLLNPELLRQWGVSDGRYAGVNAVRIPLKSETGETVSVQWRIGLEGSERFRLQGSPTLYGLHKLAEYAPAEPLWVVEGTTDCWTLASVGLQVVALPSASVGRLAEELWQVASRFEQVILALDGDSAGEHAIHELAQACPSELLPRVQVVRPPVKDWNELWCCCEGSPEWFREALRQCERVPLASLTGLTLNRESNCQTAPLVPVDLATRSPQPREWLIENLIPARHTTNLYADSGSLKSYLALVIARAVLRGTDFAGYPVCRRGSVLYLDLELDDEEHTRRWWALARGAGEATPPNGLYYVRVQSDLFSVWEHIEQLVRELSPVLVVVDSIGKAVGKPLDPDLAIRLYMLFDQLEIATIAVDHTPKPVPELPTEQVREYGTVFKRHYARSAFQLDLQEKAQNRVGLLLRHQKSTFGRTVPEIPIVFEFVSEDGNLHAVRVLTNESAVQQEELFGERGAILGFLREQGEQGATIKAIAEALNLEDWKVRRYLKLLERSQLVVRVEGSYPHRYATLTGLTPSSKTALPENELNTEPSGGSLTLLHPYIEESKCQTADVAPFDFSHRTPIEIPDDDPLERFLQQAADDLVGLTPEEAETVRLLWCFAQAQGFPSLEVEGIPVPFTIGAGQQAWLQALERIAGTINCTLALNALALDARRATAQAQAPSELADSSLPA